MYAAIVLAVVVTAALGIEYRWYYYHNISHHRILVKRFGTNYISELEDALSKEGLSKLIQQFWFVRRYKQHWAI